MHALQCCGNAVRTSHDIPYDVNVSTTTVLIPIAFVESGHCTMLSKYARTRLLAIALCKAALQGRGKALQGSPADLCTMSGSTSLAAAKASVTNAMPCDALGAPGFSATPKLRD